MQSQIPQGLTFNDVLVLPNYSDFTRDEINLSSALTCDIKLKIPFVSAPMDTVTEASLAIALGKLGGIGIIHRNLPAKQQANLVAKVKKERVLVGAAIGTTSGFEWRADKLVQAGADVLIIDSAHGYTKFVINALKFLKKHYPTIEVIAGNVATYDGAKALIEAGSDALRVGMGPGAICTTRIVSGIGVPQITAIWETYRASKGKIPIIADGGIVNSGDIVKALAGGASTVMMGGFFAATHEAPGKTIKLKASQIPEKFKAVHNPQEEYLLKEYRGMGSESAMQKGVKIKSEDEFHGKSYKGNVSGSSLVAEGAEGLVPVRGSLKKVVETAIGGVKSGLYYCGARNIKELHKKAKFIQITQQSMIESHPHDILITNAGKSYMA